MQVLRIDALDGRVEPCQLPPRRAGCLIHLPLEVRINAFRVQLRLLPVTGRFRSLELRHAAERVQYFTQVKAMLLQRADISWCAIKLILIMTAIRARSVAWEDLKLNSGPAL